MTVTAAPDMSTNYNVLAKSDYTPDPAVPEKVLGWCTEALQESDYYLRSQPGYGRSTAIRRMVLGDDKPFKDEQLSMTSDNEAGRLFGVLAADLTDWEPYWQYESGNPEHEQQVRILSSILTNWFPKYGERPTELIVKNAMLDGSGVGHMTWDPNRQDIGFKARNAKDVRPVRPFGDTGSFQDCLAVVDQREVPVNYVKNMFPHAARYIVAERDASLSAMLNQAGSKVLSRSPVMMNNQYTNAPASRLGALPVTDLFYITLDDRSINDSAGPVEMGDWGYSADGSGRRIPLNDWSYRVEPNDYLYPIKRLIIFTRTMILYDGPAMHWHGLFPYSKLTLESFPDSWFGIAPMWRLIPLQRSLDRAYRAADNHLAKVSNPGKMAPKLGVAAAELNKYKTNMPNQSIRYGPGGKPEVEQILPMDPLAMELIQHYLGRMSSHVGVQQMMNLASMGQVPEGETIEKILASVQPEIRARSRSIEAFQRDNGLMFAYDAAQFYPVGRRIAMLGADGVTKDDFDLDPYSLVPAFVGNDYNETGALRQEIIDSPRPRFDRGREFMRGFALNVKPSSMLNSAKSQEKLLSLTLRRQGDLPLYATLKKLGYQNLGAEPKESLIDQITQEKAGLPPAGSTLNMQVMQAASAVTQNPQLMPILQALVADPGLIPVVGALMQQVQAAAQQNPEGDGSGGDGSGTGGPGGPGGPGGGGESSGGADSAGNSPGKLGNPGTGSSRTASDYGPHRGPGRPPSGNQMPHMRPDGKIEESGR